MSTTHWSVDVTGGPEMAAKLEAIAQRLDDPGPLLERIGAAMQESVQLRFETKTDPDGHPWLPLSKTTLEIYDSEWFKERNPSFRNGVPGTLLERTRRMRNSLGRNVSGNILEVGFADAKEVHHEFGTQTMPRRSLLAGDPVAGTLGAEDAATVYEAMNAYLADLF